MNEKRVLIMDDEEKETGRMKEILAGTFPVLAVDTCKTPKAVSYTHLDVYKRQGL